MPGEPSIDLASVLRLTARDRFVDPAAAVMISTLRRRLRKKTAEGWLGRKRDRQDAAA